MAIAKLFKWNALVLISFFLIACSDSGGGSGSSRELETPIGHSIKEGNEDTSVLTLYFISPVDGPLTYSTFNITAAEKSDYELLADTFQAEKDKEYAFDVIVYGDTQIEGDESLGINFKDAQGESVGTIIGSITNDDYPGVSVTSPQVIEGDSGTPKLVFTFTLSAAVVDDYSITVSSIGETASVPSAFTNLATPEIDFLPVNQELVFESGELEKQLEVSVYADNLIENDETVVLKVLRVDQPKLAELYASGIIRTDETPDKNGFQLSVEDGEQKTDITEGSSINPFELTWKKIDYEITVSKPKNILQEQNLIFTLLPFTEAQTQYGVTYGKQDYVNLTNSHDLCFNDLSLDNALECQTSLNYILKQDEASFVVSIYVKEDITRELSEIFIMNIGNDQNVLFNNFQAKIINDDSENLKIKIGDEFVDLKTFTSNQSVYELTEPRAATQGTAKVIEENTLTFRVSSPLDIKYSPEYELNKYFKERPADNGEYSYADENRKLIFSTGIEAPQDVGLGINLESDGTYDGDKYITLTFKETDISPLIIKIIDSDYPKLEATTKQAGVNQDSIVENGFSYIELLEQPNAESKANEDGYMEYKYTLSQGVAAEPLLSDIRYKVTLQNAGIGKGEALPELTCLSAGHTQEYNLATLTGDDSDVSIFDNKGVEIQSGGEILLEEGSTSYDLTIRVKNDAAIECQEVFQLTVVPALAPDDIQTEVALSQNFIIKDTDKALVTVQSWQTAETDAATKTQNFQFNANKKVNAVLTPILTGQGYNCSADDLNPPIDAATTVSFTPDSLEPTFPIYIKGDTTVEPDESCELNIGTLSADLEKLIEVQYLNSNGVVIEDATHATGVIVNDDKLNISFDIAAEVTEPTNKDEGTGLGVIHWSSNNDIAENVGNIIVTFANAACINNADDCIEYSAITDAETDIKISPDSFYLNDAVLNQTNNRFEKALPISILGDDIVESLETLNMSVNSDPVYVQSIPSFITTKIVNEDKLTISFTEISPDLPLISAEEYAESGSKYYGISWGQHSVASTVPEIKFSLTDNQHQLPASLFGIASRKIQNNQSEYDYLLKFNNRFLAGNEVVLKPLNQTLSASGQIVLEISLKEEDLIEEEEKIEVTLSTSATDYVEAFSIKQAHTIGIDDQLSVSVGFPGNYEENVGESKEQDEISFHYTITSSGEVDEDVPELKLSVINAGSANSDSATLITGDVKDYVFTAPNAVTYENNFLTLKPALSSVINESIQLAYKIDNDNHVEQLESIVTSIKNIDVNSAYIQLEGTDVDSPNIELTHNIINEDKTDFYITQDDASDTSAEEGEGDPLQPIIKTYTINWTTPIGKGVSNLEFDLPFLGTATKGSDYTLTPTDTSKLTIEENLYSTSPDVYRERFSIIKDSESVLGVDGSVSFNIEINDDTEVEGTESILASLTEYVGMAEYISFSQTNNAITHYITSEEGVTFSLTQVSGNTESNEADRAYNRHRIEWSDDIGVGVGDISLQIEFSEPTSTALIAAKGSDYSVTSNSNKLIIDGDTFKIKKDSDETLTKGHLDFTVRVSNNNDLVEPDETYTLEMKKITGITPTFITVDKDNKIVSHKIIDTNKATVSLHSYYDNPTGSGYENGDGNEKTKLYYRLFWDKKIASNVPDLSIKVKLGTGSSANGNATLDDVNITKYENNTHNLTINGEDITFKSIGTELPLASSTSNYGLYFSYEIVTEDNGLVERDEDLTGSLEYISENDESKKYISLDTTYNKLDTYTILNDDKITLSLISPTVVDPNKTEADEESLSYSLKWNAPVAADVPALSVTLDPSSSDGQASVDDYTVSPVDASKLTVANKITYTFKAADQPLLVNDKGVGLVDFEIKVEDDSNVEEDETLSARLASVNTDYVTIHKTEKSLSHTIKMDGDKLPITITRVALPEGETDSTAEDNWNPKSYEISFGGVEVSEHVPELYLEFNLGASSAKEDTDGDTSVNENDFEVTFQDPIRSGNTIKLKEDGAALEAGTTYEFSFDAHNDNWVEIKESINAQISLVDNDGDASNGIDYIKFEGGLTSISHEIVSEDKTSLQIIASDSSLTTSTVESAIESSNPVIRSYKITSSNPIEGNVPDIKINLPLTTGAGYADAGSTSDFIYSPPNLTAEGSVYTIHAENSDDLSAGDVASFSIKVNNDTLVEYNEIFEAQLSINSGATYAELGTDTSVSHTIENDDFINIWLDDDAVSVFEISTLDTIKYNWSYDGLSLSENVSIPLLVTIEDSASASTSDYEIDSNLTENLLKSDSNKSGSGTAITIVDDKIVEMDESLNATLSVGSALQNASQIIKFRPSQGATQKTLFEYNIADNDFITPVVSNVMNEGDTNTTWSVDFCLPASDYSLAQDASYDFEILNTTSLVDSRKSLIDAESALELSGVPLINKSGYFNSYQNAECGFDYQSINGTTDCATLEASGMRITLLSGDFTATCMTKNVLETLANTTSEKSKHIQYSLNSIGSRGIDLDNQQLVIANDDYQLTIDTGLKKCMAQNRDIRSCETGNSGSNAEYDAKQDALTTTSKSDLAYTGIVNSGEPALATMTGTGAEPEINYGDDANPELCFQDNNTGFIWTKTTYTNTSADIYTQADDIFAGASHYCGHPVADWNIPTVQDLYSVMVMHHLRIKEGAPLSTMRNSSAYQDDILETVTYSPATDTSEFSYQHKSAYWSSDLCDTDSYWTVDFFTGLTRCEANTQTNYKIMVYKP